MSLVLRAAVIYALVWLMFRLAGKRTCSDMTTFDFVLLLILSETLQQAMVPEDTSLTAASIALITLIGLDVGMSILKYRFPKLETVLEGEPVVLVRDGRLIERRMKQMRVDQEDILSEARRTRGLTRLDQIAVALLERNGQISIIPAPHDTSETHGGRRKGLA
jgi:uncharacterized membrane protein YcaP (DUF421 family)